MPLLLFLLLGYRKGAILPLATRRSEAHYTTRPQIRLTLKSEHERFMYSTASYHPVLAFTNISLQI